MKRLLAWSAKTMVWALALLLLLGVLADLLCETHGVPDPVANGLRAALAERGISLQSDAIRAGLVRGILLDHPRLRLRCQGLALVISCTEISARPRLRDLLAGRLRAQTVTFSGASVSLYAGPATADAAATETLRLERCRGEAHRRRDGVVDLTVEGLAEKIAVQLDAELRGLDSARWTERSAATRPAGRNADPPAPTAPEHLARIARWLAAAHLSERDAFLSGRLVLDLERPAELSFAGEIGVSELVLGDLLVSRLKSAVHYRRPELRFDPVTLVLGQGQVVSGRAVVDVAAGTVSGHAQGKILPATLRHLPNTTLPAWLDRIRTAEPLAVVVDLETSPLRPAKWHLKAELSGTDITVPGLSLSRLTAAGSWDGDTLAVARWSAAFGDAGAESAAGHFAWHRADATIEGQARVSCHPAERIREAGNAALARTVRQVEFANLITVDATLARSPLDWRRLRAHATLAADAARWRGRAFAPLAASVELSAAVLRVEGLTIGLPAGPADALALSASVSLAQALESGTWDVRAQIRGKALKEASADPAAGAAADPVWQDAVDLSAAVLYTPDTGAVDITAEGLAFPGLWYATFVPRLGLPDSAIMREIRCAPDAPARLAVAVNRADQRAPFLLTGSAAAEGARYADLVFRTVHGQIELTANALSFTNIEATTSAGDDLALDLRIDFQPLAVTIRKGRILGNPEVVSTFIDDRDAKAIYRRVWKGFHWDTGRPPAIDLRQFAYRQTPGGRTWGLTLDASIGAEQASYRDLPVKRFTAVVELDLPERVEVRSARIESDTAVNEGRVTILTGANPKCDFEIRQVQGGQDPARVLGLLNPDWSAALGPLAFSADSAVDCRGSFYLSREPLLQVSGTLRAPYADFRGLRVEEPDVQWRLSQSAVHWNLTSGRLFGGPLAMTGVYDVDTGQGSLALRGQSMALKQLSEYVGMRSAESSGGGLVDAHCNLQILRGWAGRDLQVYGDGFLGISQADLWRVPLFDPLGRLLDVSFLNRLTGGKTSGLGRITRLDADLGFTGDRAAIRSLTTDGTLLSLRGRGEYCWETDRIAMSVTGQTLDNAGIVSWIFRPLSWAFFSAELTGTSKDHKWRLANAFSKALPGRSGAAGELEAIPVPEP